MTLTLLLDLDDTLLDSNIDSLIPVYFQKLGAHLASYVPPEKIFPALVKGTTTMYTSQDSRRTLKQVFGEHFYASLGLSEEDLSAPLEDFYDNIFPALQPLTKPRPEAIDFVEWAFDQGWNVAIATDPLFPRKAILHRLRWANLAPEKYPFSLIPDFETFHFAKASISYFPEFLAYMGWTEGPLLMVGDSFERDVVPAQNAGIPVFWLTGDVETDSRVNGCPRGTLVDLRKYVERVDMASLKPDFSSPAAIISVLQATAAIIHSLTLPGAIRDWKARPSMDEWCFTEILCHLRDVDIEVNIPRFGNVLSQENAFITGQVTDPWAEERQYICQDGVAAFRGFAEARASLVDNLKKLSPVDWEKPARHTIFGPTTLRELLNLAADHDRSHIRQAMALKS